MVWDDDIGARKENTSDSIKDIVEILPRTIVSRVWVTIPNQEQELCLFETKLDIHAVSLVVGQTVGLLI